MKKLFALLITAALTLSAGAFAADNASTPIPVPAAKTSAPAKSHHHKKHVKKVIKKAVKKQENTAK